MKSMGSKTSTMESNEQGRRLFIMRHGERVDFTFVNWLEQCFDSNGQYIRKDLNLPKTIPKRKGGHEAYAHDSPLTVMGTVQATLVGEAMKENDIIPDQVFCSPSLRCVQTCHFALKGLDALEIPINIEPGLFEWCGWYQWHPNMIPDFMTIDELIEAGFNINVNYKPSLTVDELRLAAKKEHKKAEPYYIRNYNVTQHVLNLSTQPQSNILLVGHAPSLDACTHQLTGKKPRSLEKFQETMRVDRKTYCEVCMVQENGKGQWKNEEVPFPPLNHRSTNCGYNNGLPVAPWKGKENE